MPLFELYRKKPVCIRMTTLWVVEHLNVVEDVAPRLFAVGIDAPANPFPLQ